MKKLMISACFLLTLAGCSDSERAQYIDEGKPGAALAIANSMLNTQAVFTDRAQSLLNDLESFGVILCSYKKGSRTQTGFQYDGNCPSTIDNVTADAVDIEKLMNDYGNNYFCIEKESTYDKINSGGNSYKIAWTKYAPKDFLKGARFNCDK